MILTLKSVAVPLKLSTRVLLLLPLVFLSLVTSPARAQYSITPIDYLYYGHTIVYGINNNGDIVGVYNDDFFGNTPGGKTEGFRQTAAGVTTVIAVPGASQTTPTGINDTGVIVGTYIDSGGNTHGFLLSGTIFTTLDDPSGIGKTSASGINSLGQIVGTYIDSGGNTHGFLLSGTIFTTLDDPSGIGKTSASGINSLGQIVGTYTDSSGNTHGFLDSSGTFTTLDDPSGVGTTTASGINDAGQIVGNYNTTSDEPLNFSQGFLESGGVYTDQTDPSELEAGTAAYAINNSGQIAGYYDTDASFPMSYGAFVVIEVGYVESNSGVYSDVSTHNVSLMLTGISDTGQIAGYYPDPDNEQEGRGILDAGGVFSVFDLSTGDYGDGTYALGVDVNSSNTAQIVGYYTSFSQGLGTSVGGFDTGSDAGSLQLGSGPLEITEATGISNNQIVGWYENSDDVSANLPAYGFLENTVTGTVSSVAYPGANDTYPAAINAKGQIVGTYDDSTGTYGFRETGGVYSLLANPNGTVTYPSGINYGGQIVGTYTDSSNVSHGFVYFQGIFTDFAVPGAVSTSPRGINYAGQIVGSYSDVYGDIHGFLATPPPLRPQSLRAVASPGKVTLTWIAPSGPVTNYSVYRGTVSGGETLYKTGLTTASYLDTAVTSGTTYFYKVQAFNAAGSSPISGEAQATPISLPSAPRTLNAVVGNSQVTLTWTAPVSGPVTSYSVYRGTVSGGETFYKTALSATYFVNTYVTDGVKYFYYIKAVNAAGTGPASSEVSATPVALPSAPRSLSAVAAPGKVTLTWTAPVSGPVTSYSVYRGTVSGGETFYKTALSATYFVNTYVTHGVKYFYYIKAINAAGTGPASNEVSATP